jgi:hypothetical protein
MIFESAAIDNWTVLDVTNSSTDVVELTMDMPSFLL